ncbi:MAG: BatD family protein [Salinibacter sp.]
MSVRTAVVILVLGGLLGVRASAQSGSSVRVTAQAEPMTTTVGETIAFTVRVEGAPATVIQTPDQPRAVNLEPQREAPQTQQIRSVEGGTLRRSVVYSWQFRAQRAGTARLRPVTVVVRGEQYTTSSIRIRVSADDASRPTLTHPEGKTSGTLDRNDLFVRASASTDRAYQNEQVVVEYRLFYRPGIRLRHSHLADSWDAPGFWREELKVASRPTPAPRRVGGRRYETVVLKQVALFPTQPGTLRVDPLRIETEAQGTVRRRHGGPALRGRFESVQLASQRLSVRVRPLPPGAPASFDGAVGQFSMTARADADSITVGESVPLTVRITGTGGLSTLSPPSLDVPSAIEVYEPTVQTDIDRTGQRIRGTKTFTYTLVPRSGGRHVLPPVSFSYFDPEARRYETLRAEVPPLPVSGTAAQRVVGRTGNGLPVGDVTAPVSAEETQWVRTPRRPLYRQRWPYLAVLIPVLGAGGAVAYRRWGRGGESDRDEDTGGSLDAAQDHLQEARRRLQGGGDAAVSAAVEQSLRTVLGARLERDGAEPSRTMLDRQLSRHDVPDDLQTRLYELLDRCDEAQYAPGSSTRDLSTEDLDDAETLLRRLHEQVSSPTDRSERS